MGSKTQRAALLDEVHASQAKLDCLDDLIYKLRLKAVSAHFDH